ncbi:MAG: hypothetical protein CMJ83_00675 [Planctomycetes bacterium]|nr:hypothetical protein [Planctomycetota bacterium]
MNDPWVLGALIGGALAVILYLRRSVTASGAIAGAGLCTVFLGAGGGPALAGFALLVVGGSVVTGIGRERKATMRRGDGRDEARRDAGQALANAGPAALLLLAVSSGGLVAALGALAAAFADTASSELGLLARSRPRMLLLGPPVDRGVDGGMSPIGTVAGGLGAGCAGALGAALAGGGYLVAIVAGGVAGTVCDSLLGATLEPRLPKRIGNDVVNALASAVGGGVAWWIGAA